jgi:hypothetical protein
MRKRIMAFVFVSALLMSTVGALIGPSMASADKGGCPNANSANGALNANANSAHGADKVAARGC